MCPIALDRIEGRGNHEGHEEHEGPEADLVFDWAAVRDASCQFSCRSAGGIGLSLRFGAFVMRAQTLSLGTRENFLSGINRD